MKYALTTYVTLRQLLRHPLAYSVGVIALTTIFLVALDWQSADEVRQYVERHDLGVPVLLGTRQTGTDWGVSVFPTYYMLDRDHRVVHRDYGYSTLAGLWGRSLFL